MKSIFFVTSTLSIKTIDLMEMHYHNKGQQVYSFGEYRIGDVAYQRRNKEISVREVINNVGVCVIDCRDRNPLSKGIFTLAKLELPLLFVCEPGFQLRFPIEQLQNSHIIYSDIWRDIGNESSELTKMISILTTEDSVRLTLDSPSEGEAIILVERWSQILTKIQHDFGSIYQIGHREFEELVAELLVRENYEVELTQPKRDGGRDILAYQKGLLGRHLHLVECKHYAPDNKVPVNLVRSLYGVFSHEQANSATLITTSGFTKPAILFAEKVSQYLTLRDGKFLSSWISETGNKLAK